MNKDFIVDTQEWLVECPKFSPALMISAADCTACPYHAGLWEEFPGIAILGNKRPDGSRLVLGREPREVTPDELSLEPFLRDNAVDGEQPKSRRYFVQCGMPRRIDMRMRANIIENMEV